VTGIFSYWFAVIAFGAWILVVAVLLIGAVNRQGGARLSNA
jgi:hypothetical protein